MATVVLSQQADRFPVGTQMFVYPASARISGHAPSGESVTNAVVQPDGSITFGGLEDDAHYVAYAYVNGHYYVGISTPAVNEETAVFSVAEKTGNVVLYTEDIADFGEFSAAIDRIAQGAQAHAVKVVPDADHTLEALYAGGLVVMTGLTADRDVTVDTMGHSGYPLTAGGTKILNESLFTVRVLGAVGVDLETRYLGPGDWLEVIPIATDVWISLNGTKAMPEVDADPVLILAPVESGVFRTGEEVTAGGSIYDVQVTLAYQWQADTAGNDTFVNIGGATSANFTLTSSEEGDKVRRKETATGLNGKSIVVYSNATFSAAAAGSKPIFTSPAAAILPTSPDEGTPLTVGTVPGFSNSPTLYRYQWQKNTGSGMANIVGASGSSKTYAEIAALTYTPTSNDPHQLVIWASNAAGESVASTASNSVTPVAFSTTMRALLQHQMETASEHLPSLNPGWSFVPNPDSPAMTAFLLNAWGQIAPGIEGNSSQCKFEFGDLQLNLWDGDQWVNVLFNKLITAGMGSLYASQTYAGAGTPSIATSPTGRSLERLLGVSPFHHFWTSQFYDLNNLSNLINRNNFEGGYAAFKVRLDPATPELHDEANYVASAAADQRTSAGQGGTIPNVGIGQWIEVTSDWRYATMTFDLSHKAAVFADDPMLPIGYEGELAGVPDGGGGSTPLISLDLQDVVTATTSPGVYGKVITLPSGSNRHALFAVHMSGTDTTTRVQIDGVACTFVARYTSTAGGTARVVELWEKPAHVTGSRNVEFYGSYAGTPMMGVYCFSNVDQATPRGTIVSGFVDAGTSLDIPTTGGEADDLVVALASVRTTGAVTEDAAQTERYNTLRGTNLRCVGTTQDGGTGTIHSIFNWTGADKGVAVAIPLKAAA